MASSFSKLLLADCPLRRGFEGVTGEVVHGRPERAAFPVRIPMNSPCFPHVFPDGPNNLRTEPRGLVAVENAAAPDADSPDGALTSERRCSHRHRAPRSARHRTLLRGKRRGDGLEPPPGELGRPPAGIARECETSADDAAPCQRELPILSQAPMARLLTAPSYPGPRLSGPSGTGQESWRRRRSSILSSPRSRSRCAAILRMP